MASNYQQEPRVSLFPRRRPLTSLRLRGMYGSRPSVIVKREKARKLGIIIRHSPELAAAVLRGEITPEKALRIVARRSWTSSC
jgi:hypothetical protein